MYKSRPAAKGPVPRPARPNEFTRTDTLEIHEAIRGRSCQYLYKGVLADGGFGYVTLYQHRDTGLQVAVKTAKTSSGISSLLYEIRLHLCLDHPNIVPYLGSSERVPYLVMGYVDGTTVGKAVPGYPYKDRLALILGVVSNATLALGYMHESGIIHRDIKPDNLMIGKRGEVVVVDLGLATFIGQQRTDCPPSFQVGTRGYGAPELEQEKDGRSDIYSLGITALELIYNRDLSQADLTDRISLRLRLAQLLKENRKVGCSTGKVIEAVTAMIFRAIDPKPERRCPNMKEMSVAATVALTELKL